MNELRRILRHQLRAPLCAVALGCLVPLQVAAQVADPAFERFRSQVVGNTVNFSYGGAGTPLGGAGNATGIGVTSGVDVSRPARVSTKHGPINGTLVQKLSQGAMGSAFARAAGTVLGPVGLAFLAVPVIVDWMTDAGVAFNDGQFQKPEDRDPSMDDAWENRAGSGDWTFSGQAACMDYLVAAGIPAQYNIGTITFTAPGTCVANIQQINPPGQPYGNFGFTVSYRARQGDPPPPGFEPVDNAELESRMSSVNPGPEALAELYKLGQTMNLANPIPDLVDTLRAEFEARSPESVTTETTDTPSETKTDQKTCATYTQVVGGTLSLVEQCETVTTTQAKDPETGAPVGDPVTTTKTTIDGTPDNQVREEEQTAEDPCINNPNRAGCVELGTPEGEIPSGTRSVAYTPESVFGAGTCPADKSVVAYGMTLQLTNMAQACDLLDTYVKPIAILLAAFTALMIVAVGVPE